MTRMIDPRWEREISRRAVVVALTGAPLALATAWHTARAQSTPAVASPDASTGSMTASIVAAGNAFLGALSEAEKQTGLFEWSDTTQKQNWSNLPAGLFPRAGLMWGDLGSAQQTALLQVMQATLSAEGYQRVLAEWHADDALAAESDGGQGMFGSAYYYFALIGAPSETDPWQWQYGGHHVTINATIAGPNLVLTPSFIGTQPSTYTDANGNTVRPLGDIEDDAFALIGMLDPTQQQATILGDAPINLVLGPGEDGKTIPPAGLPAAQMSEDQKQAFIQLIGHYGGLGNDQAGQARMDEITSTLDDTYLAWYGPTTPGSAAYFRITGPTLVIEYAPQGNRGSDASTDHIHGIYRDPTNDYGERYTGLRIGG